MERSYQVEGARVTERPKVEMLRTMITLIVPVRKAVRMGDL